MPIYTADCIIGTKKLWLIYSGSNFHHDNTWDEKRWWSSYSGVPIIAKAYHLKHKCHDAPKFGLGLQCSAMWPTRNLWDFVLSTYQCWNFLVLLMKMPSSQGYIYLWIICIYMPCFSFPKETYSLGDRGMALGIKELECIREVCPESMHEEHGLNI